MYLYRSIFLTYVGEYDSAVEDLNKSWKQHWQSKKTLKVEDTPLDAPEKFLK